MIVTYEGIRNLYVCTRVRNTLQTASCSSRLSPTHLHVEKFSCMVKFFVLGRTNYVTPDVEAHIVRHTLTTKYGANLASYHGLQILVSTSHTSDGFSTG